MKTPRKAGQKPTLSSLLEMDDIEGKGQGSVPLTRDQITGRIVRRQRRTTFSA
jgi:hypothetical protein